MATMKTFYVSSTGKRHTAACRYAKGYTHTVTLTADQFSKDWYHRACWRCSPRIYPAQTHRWEDE